jgi:hypothetical protein
MVQKANNILASFTHERSQIAHDLLKLRRLASTIFADMVSGMDFVFEICLDLIGSFIVGFPAFVDAVIGIFYFFGCR